MSVRENLQLIKARYEAVNAHDLNKFQGFYADSIVWNDPGLNGPVKGPRSVRNRLKVLTSAFPDLQWKLDNLFAQGENVCAEFTFTGTHKGELSDNRSDKKFSATNKSIRVQACGVYVVRESKIIESRIYFDFGSLVAQIQKR